MKKLTALLLTAVMIFGLAACGAADDGTSSDQSSPAPTSETVVITLDNWLDYFNYAAKTDVSTDGVCVYFEISLKDEIAESCTEAAVSFSVREMQAYPCQMEYNIQTSDQKTVTIYTANEYAAKHGTADLSTNPTETGEFKKAADDVGTVLKLRSKMSAEGSVSQEGTVVTWDTILYQSNEVTEAAGTLILTK